MARPIGEWAVREEHTNNENAGSYEDDIEQIIRDHAPL